MLLALLIQKKKRKRGGGEAIYLTSLLNAEERQAAREGTSSIPYLFIASRNSSFSRADEEDII